MSTLKIEDVVRVAVTEKSLATPNVNIGRFNSSQVSANGTGFQRLERDVHELRATLQALSAQTLPLTPEAKKFLTEELVPYEIVMDRPTPPAKQIIGLYLKQIQRMLLYLEVRSNVSFLVSAALKGYQSCAKSAGRDHEVVSGPPESEPRSFRFRERTTSVSHVEVRSETRGLGRSATIQQMRIDSIRGGTGGSGGRGSGRGGNGGMGAGPRFDVARVQNLNVNWHIYVTDETVRSGGRLADIVTAHKGPRGRMEGGTRRSRCGRLDILYDGWDLKRRHVKQECGRELRPAHPVVYFEGRSVNAEGDDEIRGPGQSTRLERIVVGQMAKKLEFEAESSLSRLQMQIQVEVEDSERRDCKVGEMAPPWQTASGGGEDGAWTVRTRRGRRWGHQQYLGPLRSPM
ncbi:hypothetical protein R3P38DRAFT_3565890 [Favolaschia claudopus]|uniref:Uncharacterized protein n=1 Tax=Favolaschia claudopus TaxID=2862362 RepID=A0AAW0DV90_9AGAR